MITLKTLSRLGKCCPALIYLSVKNNQIQDLKEVEHLSGIRLKGFEIDGNPIHESQDEINRVIRKTFPLIVTGKAVRFVAFDFMAMRMLPKARFNMVKYPQCDEMRPINKIAEYFMKMFKLNRFTRESINEYYDPAATVSVIEDRMYARDDAYALGRKRFFTNKVHTQGLDNISRLYSQKLKGKFPITDDCYIIDSTPICERACMLSISGFVRQLEMAFTRAIVFYVNPQGKYLITNDSVNMWREFGPNIISFVNPSSAVSNGVTRASVSAAAAPSAQQASAPQQILASIPPEDAKFVEEQSAKTGFPIHVIIDYITRFGKTKEQAASDFSNPAIVNEIKRLIKASEAQK